jgi:xylobiose transport system permease protein
VTTMLGRGRPSALWAAPAAIFFAIFGLVPIGAVFYLSFTEWNVLGSPKWTGLTNWARLADDPDVIGSLRVTIVLAILCWLVQTPISLLLGVWSAGLQRNRAVLSAIFFMPLLLSTVAITLTWLSLLDPNFGLAMTIGRFVGVPDGNFLGDGNLALYTVAFVVTWQFVPFHALIYQAATRQIPTTLYEAARIDGASRYQRFFSVTLPQLRHTMVASSILIIIGSLTYFESILLLTGGGPGTATRVLPLHMYVKGFIGFDLGYASVLSVVMVVVGAALSIAIVRVTGYHRMSSQREGL